MPRPGVGNPGNSGGYGYDKEYRENQAKLKKMAVAAAIKWLETGKLEFPGTHDLLLKLVPACMPREVELSGSEDKNPIQIVLKELA